MALPAPPDDSVLLGTLGRTFQLQGGLRFYPLGEAEAEAIGQLHKVFLSGWGERGIARLRPVGAQLIIYFVGVSTPQGAKALVNAEVYAPRQALPKAQGFYLDLLLGLPVFVEGEPFGEVVEVVSATSRVGQDLLVVARDDEEHLIPLGADYVRVDDAGVGLENPPEGLFDLHRPE